MKNEEKKYIDILMEIIYKSDSGLEKVEKMKAIQTLVFLDDVLGISNFIENHTVTVGEYKKYYSKIIREFDKDYDEYLKKEVAKEGANV